MGRSRTLTVLAGAVLAVASTVAAPMTAQAATVTTTVYTRDGGATGGRAEWTANGDRLRVCDIDKDGWSARAVLQWIGDDHYTHQFTATATGDGNCTTVHKNIEDHHTGWVSVYLVHASTTNSPWVGYHNVETTT